jgi:hypothetical protein
MEHFKRAQQNLSSLHKIRRRPSEKILPAFFNMRIPDLDFYGENAKRWIKWNLSIPIFVSYDNKSGRPTERFLAW